MGDDGEPEEVTGELVASSAANSGEQRIGRPWPKGVSGNPTGRPKAERDIVELARQRGPEVIKRLFYIAMRGDIRNPTTVLAAKLLLERGYGKAPIRLEDPNGNPAGNVFVIAMPAPRSDDDGE